MSFSRMKPLPKAILILAIVGAVGFGAKYGMQFLPKAEPVVPPAPTVAVPAESAQPVPVATVRSTSTPVAEPPDVRAGTITSAPANAGLDALLGSGKK
jgi:hypothetical protein